MTHAGQSAADALHDDATASGGPGPARFRDVVAAYVGLTKPRVIELLLLTTVPVMFFAARGVPPLGLVVATVVGGSFSAGSASVFNCVYDRDIDETTTWGHGETVLATRGSSSRPAWVAYTDSAGTRAASYLGSIDTCNHVRLSSSARSNSEVLFKNTVEWLLDL